MDAPEFGDATYNFGAEQDLHRDRSIREQCDAALAVLYLNVHDSPTHVLVSQRMSTALAGIS